MSTDVESARKRSSSMSRKTRQPKTALRQRQLHRQCKDPFWNTAGLPIRKRKEPRIVLRASLPERAGVFALAGIPVAALRMVRYGACHRREGVIDKTILQEESQASSTYRGCRRTRSPVYPILKMSRESATQAPERATLSNILGRTTVARNHVFHEMDGELAHHIRGFPRPGIAFARSSS